VKLSPVRTGWLEAAFLGILPLAEGRGSDMLSERRIVILMAEDDDDDRVLMRDALAESDLDCDFRCVNDGAEMMDYLYRRGKHWGADAPRPNLILLDLNMPVKDGREVLRELKENPEFKDIPVVVLTESLSNFDCLYCYRLGVQSFFTKAAWLESLPEVIKASGQYWFDLMTGKTRTMRAEVPIHA
jgi:CheY-like chemotaxis protein